jgi:antirestriction protein ArdC
MTATNHEAETVISEYCARSGVKLYRNHSDRAYYNPTRDDVNIPNIQQYDEIAAFYGVAFHELTHSTGHVSRLNRIESTNMLDKSYGREELVAEIGAAASLHILNIETPNTFKNSAAYIQNWLHAIREDKYMIVAAAGRAEKATELIFGENNKAEEAI